MMGSHHGSLKPLFKIQDKNTKTTLGIIGRQNLELLFSREQDREAQKLIMTLEIVKAGSAPYIV